MAFKAGIYKIYKLKIKRLLSRGRESLLIYLVLVSENSIHVDVTVPGALKKQTSLGKYLCDWQLTNSYE